jgi:hypothetical protein
MTHNDAHTARAQSTLNSRSKQRLAKHGGDTQTNAEERAVPLREGQVPQTTTETREYTNDVHGRWSDDGGQNTTTLMDGAQSF